MINQKIALCLSGQMRTYKKVYPSLEKNILRSLNPDIFIHTWANSGIVTKANSKVKNSFTEEAVQYSTLEKIYNPKKSVIEVFKEEYFYEKGDVKVPSELKQATIHYKGNIPMFYKIKKCNDLKREYEKENNFRYDIVIRLRPDLAIKEPIPQKILETPDTLWFSDYAINTNFQVSDKFALSNSPNMDYYCSVWNKLSEYWKKPLGDGKKENYRVGERLIYHHMKESKIPYRPFDINCFILRQPEVSSSLDRLTKRLKASKVYRKLKGTFLHDLIKGIKNTLAN